MLLPLFSAPCFLSSFLLGSFSSFLPLFPFHSPLFSPLLLVSFFPFYFSPFIAPFLFPFLSLFLFLSPFFPPLLLLVFFSCFNSSLLSLFPFLLSPLCPFILPLLVSFPPSLLQDNFGFDLQAVEAATKKHEAIETDIAAYEERVQVSSTG